MSTPRRISPDLRPGSPIMLVGEAPGQQEELIGLPFKGKAGQELNTMLREAGINRFDCSLTNVFLSRPPNNELEAWCVSKAEVTHNLGPLGSGKYIRDDLAGEVERLREEILSVKPNLVVALGAVPCWALLRAPYIKKLRGTVVESTLVPGQKVLPTYHPAYILRQWGDRPIAITDLQKARRQAAFPEIRRPKREVWIEPTLSDIRRFIETYLRPARKIAWDIETARGLITCISFSPNPWLALVIPFVDWRNPGYSYWPTQAEEVTAWAMVQEILDLPVAKITHNGFYDMHQTWKHVGICPAPEYEDTMLLAHSQTSEMEKSLGFLGSIHTDEPAWKLMRKKSEKKDD